MPASVGPRKHAVQRCSVARAHSLHANLLVVSCFSLRHGTKTNVPLFAMARQCRSLLLLVVPEVETMQAVQCLDACPGRRRVRSRGRHDSQVHSEQGNLSQNGYER